MNLLLPPAEYTTQALLTNRLDFIVTAIHHNLRLSLRRLNLSLLIAVLSAAITPVSGAEKGIAAAVASVGALVLSTSDRVAPLATTDLSWPVLLVTLVNLMASILLTADFLSLVRRRLWLMVPVAFLLVFCLPLLMLTPLGLFAASRGLGSSVPALFPQKVGLDTFEIQFLYAVGPVGLWSLVTLARIIKGRADQNAFSRRLRWLFSCQLLLLTGLAAAFVLAKPHLDYWSSARSFTIGLGGLMISVSGLIGLVNLLRKRCWKMIAANVLIFGLIITLALLLGALATCLTDTAIQQYASLLFKTLSFLKEYWWVFLVAGGYSVFFSFRLVERKYGLTAATWMLNRFIAIHIIFVAIGVTAILAVR